MQSYSVSTIQYQKDFKNGDIHIMVAKVPVSEMTREQKGSVPCWWR